METRSGLITRLHVNQHVIKANAQHGRNDPVLTIKHGGKTYTANTVEILGPSKLVYAPEDPLSCGARVWIETTAMVRLDPT